MAGEALRQLGEGLSRVGSAMGNAAISIYDADARRQTSDSMILLAEQTEAWKRSLIGDPDYGAPTGMDGSAGDSAKSSGWMKKWEDQQAVIEMNVIEGITNPKAKKAVQAQWRDMVASQTTAVQRLQFDRWSVDMTDKTVAYAQKIVDQGMPVEDAVRVASTEFDVLVGAGIWNATDREKAISAMVQTGASNELYNAYKEIAKTKGKEAAELAVAESSKSYTVNGVAHTVGAAAKESALKRGAAFDTAFQGEMMKGFQDQYEAARMKGEDGGKFRTALIGQVYKSGLNLANTDYWERKLSFDADKEANKGAAHLDGLKKEWGVIASGLGSHISSMSGTSGTLGSFVYYVPGTGEEKSVVLDKPGLDAFLKTMGPYLQNELIPLREKIEKMFAAVASPPNAWDDLNARVAEGVKGTGKWKISSADAQRMYSWIESAQAGGGSTWDREKIEAEFTRTQVDTMWQKTIDETMLAKTYATNLSALVQAANTGKLATSVFSRAGGTLPQGMLAPVMERLLAVTGTAIKGIPGYEDVASMAPSYVGGKPGFQRQVPDADPTVQGAKRMGLPFPKMENLTLVAYGNGQSPKVEVMKITTMSGGIAPTYSVYDNGSKQWYPATVLNPDSDTQHWVSPAMEAARKGKKASDSSSALDDIYKGLGW
jgi:hypothetical protein